MSTRSQLRFVQRIEYETDDGEFETTERTAQVYRHSDGYPEAVLPDLSHTKRVLDRTRSVRGPGYAAAQFILFEKLRAMKLYLDRDPARSIHATRPADLLDVANFEHLDQPVFLLGHGVENPADGIHGDEEYLYVVELPEANGITPGGTGDWDVKVSEHCGFSRWDGPTDEAYARATWQFEGPLSEAIEELVASI